MDDKVLIEVLFEQGLSLAQVSKLTGVSITALHGLDMHTKRKPRHCDELKTLAKELRSQGYTSKEISKYIGVPASTIRSWSWTTK